MTTPRAGAAVIEVDGVLYAIGGIDGKDFLRSSEYSRVDDNGDLGDWQLASTLNEARGFFDAAYHNGYLYVAGGGNGPSGHNLLRTVERAAVLPSGNLGQWQTEPQRLVYPRRCVKLAVADGYLYAFGGFSGTLLDSVERARIHPDGHLGPWSLVRPAMTMPRYVHGMKKKGNAFYVVGGHSEAGGAGQREVEWRPSAGNEAAPWRSASSMQTGRYALATAAGGDYLYAMGGLNGPRYLRSIEKARFTGDGALASWQPTTGLSSPRANFAGVVYRDRLYIIGGTNKQGYYNTVERATLNEQGDPGFWATAQRARAYRERQQARSEENALPLPNSGVVRQVIQTDLYSYVQVQGAQGVHWLAGPRTELQTGDRIRYSRGVAMADFYSKHLQRRFDAIRFVEGLEKEPRK